ncbi:uncharacterized protein LOC121736072 [Aricia agestis]|uniref:uncharacterized protein LOC121736072 n=1 Tax=Aricia agestis TaxID=91739 RepID=UPI001C20585F|nr:uncharacterized protein LOC121736072 [Aricia agestis]
MAYGVGFFIIVQAIFLQSVFGQCVNRVVPSCQSNLVEALLPNQVFLREGVIPGPPIIPAPIAGPILPEVGYSPTIIQDSGVANSLANALQLLVVSSLLSNTLPGPCDYPAYPANLVPAGYPYPIENVIPAPYSYIYFLICNFSAISMAIKSCLIIIISIYEVASYVHPYGAKPFYPRGPRPREFYIDPTRIQQNYANPSQYPYPVQEAIPTNYPVYQNPVEQPNYQVYQQVLEPNPATYPIYQQALEPNVANYPVYQQTLEPNANYAIYQQPVEPNPVTYPVYQPVETVAEIQVPMTPPAVAPTLPSAKNDKPAGFDSNVINNLAIALQLLIINNLISNPAPNSPSLDAIKTAIEGAKLAVNKPCEAEYEYPLLNAKFLGSSNFDDASSMIAYGGFGSPVTSPRVGALLKSPYDYLSSSSSEYPSKSNLQNPYAAIFSPDNIKELFTLSDYY